MSDESSETPELHVDSDWKDQVKQEKEKLKQESTEDTPTEETTQSTPAESSSQTGPAHQPSPEAMFAMLVSSIASQAFMALGQLPDPETKSPVVRPDSAKHYIDTLGILEAKTKGNLSKEEAQFMEDLLHKLRMMYVSIQPEKTEDKPADDS
ncbi:MAG: hypothetical protein COA78_28555 [Blastopirellula sp.]|nr:MAG: hypothetical protein COA78_28555 [Blastopirellula sp.]